jgi:hypothetical protein
MVRAVPIQLIGQAMGTVKKYAQVSGENYSSGSATMQISIVPGGASSSSTALEVSSGD